MDEENKTIAARCKMCQAAFQSLRSLAQVSKDDQTLVAADVQSGRFQIWAENIGALQPLASPSSLETRLRDGPDAKKLFVKFIERCIDSLGKALVLLLRPTPSRDIFVEVLQDDLEGTEHDSNSDENLDEPLEVINVLTTEVMQLLRSVKSSIDNLLRLSMIIRRVPIEDDYMRATAHYCLPSTWDIRHIRDMYPKAYREQPSLVKKLGQALTKRREFLRYREEHQQKLAQNILSTEDGAKSIARTKATSYHETPGTDLIEAIRGAETDENSLGSDTSYAPTLFEGDTSGLLNPPKMPELAVIGEPFQCPYCYTIQIVKSKQAWKKHVFSDLRPYVCTYADCDLRMFSSQRRWFEHELAAHRQTWQCIYCPSKNFSARKECAKHVRSTHGDKYAAMSTPLAKVQLDAIVVRCEKQQDQFFVTACPLCEKWAQDLKESHARKVAAKIIPPDSKPYGTRKQFQRHLGRHFEQMALSALYSHYNSEEFGSSDEEDSDNLSVEMEIIGDKSDQNEGQKGLQPPVDGNKEEPIKFKDCIGRKFSFPFHLVKTWEGMEDLIRQAFMHVDIIGPEVAEGHYDLFGPNGEIILPAVWESAIEPGWVITQALRPLEPETLPEKNQGLASKLEDPTTLHSEWK